MVIGFSTGQVAHSQFIQFILSSFYYSKQLPVAVGNEAKIELKETAELGDNPLS